MTLIYSDNPLGAVGFVDIRDPRAPRPAGTLALDGEPTAVSVAGAKALVGVNTSKSYTAPSGHLAVIDLPTRKIVARCDLGGQPDSTAVRSEEHPSELQSLMRISYDVFCLKKKKQN